MVDGSTRFGAFVRILLPLVAPGLVATSIFAFISPGTSSCSRTSSSRPGEADGDGLAGGLHDAARHRLGAADGRRDADRAARARLLPARPPEDRVRADRRRRSRVERRARAARRRLPARRASRGSRCPTGSRRWLETGLGGVVLFARNVDEPAQVAELTAALRAERPELVVAIDEEGGDVTRLEAAAGSSYPGNWALGVVDDVALTERVAAAIGADLARGRRQPRPRPGRRRQLEPGATRSSASARSAPTPSSSPATSPRSSRASSAAGVAACAKHFPGHGDTRGGLAPRAAHRRRDDETMTAMLLPFRAAIDAGARAVMTAHIRVRGARRRARRR